MKRLWIVLALVLSNSTAFSADRFPEHPDPGLTPGSLCRNASERRYPERIRYCGRSVGKALKEQIIDTYDRRFGYDIGDMDRGQFKIDHYIPLCMGGSNEANNLWPQHESVYRYTDQLEDFACQKMAQGKLRQADAVALVKQAKADLSKAEEVTKYVRSL